MQRVDREKILDALRHCENLYAHLVTGNNTRLKPMFLVRCLAQLIELLQIFFIDNDFHNRYFPTAKVTKFP